MFDAGFVFGAVLGAGLWVFAFIIYAHWLKDRMEKERNK